MSDSDLELAVELLGRAPKETLALAAAVDIIETVTTDPHRTREILAAAEERGYIERDGSRITPTGPPLAFEEAIITREGEFTCTRCGATLTTGHFMDLDAGEWGPFGSTCIRKVTGRE